MAKKTIYESHVLSALRNRLPSGYGVELQKRVKKTNGKNYRLDSIYRALMYKHQSARVIQAALEYDSEVNPHLPPLSN